MSWILQTNDYKQSFFSHDENRCSLKQRTLSALKKVLLFWIFAIASIVVPLLHFILVPGFLIGGVIAFRLHMRNTHYLDNVQFLCPNCGKGNTQKKFYFFSGKRIRCSHCSHQASIIATAS
ncbi:MAG: hypothetical protein A2622_08535 [Bdellovibrionales bacterium RIFCSPHIGHO2_01_FULL_40_29]|nr:MAG: hypothetical protein A2622_08535 [Bdellovibrionales bacterium RIFCSPHIGHO2_01_FULL_40_29]OFZ35536.1 MAG: hypothetical protein A3D17_07770 [Bdellovibrionales bacterium RIFCSPHIGHO2_02_FULL_40_15]